VFESNNGISFLLLIGGGCVPLPPLFFVLLFALPSFIVEALLETLFSYL
jgi:hypothetical protein